MYESPIEILKSKIQVAVENQVCKAVMDSGVIVDKEELLKALAYDRNQYEQGYKDGFEAALKEREEQGRLVVLPEKLDPKRLLNIIADLVCPRYVGLEDWGHDKEKCPNAGCNECWEKALKGE